MTSCYCFKPQFKIFLIVYKWNREHYSNYDKITDVAKNSIKFIEKYLITIYMEFCAKMMQYICFLLINYNMVATGI